MSGVGPVTRFRYSTIAQGPQGPAGLPGPAGPAGATPAAVFYDVRNYGAAGNANYQKPADLKWYVDAGFITEATDDTAAITAAIAAATASTALGQPATVRLTGNHYLKTPPISGYGPLNQAAFFVLPSKVTVQGSQGAALRVAPGLNAGAGGGWAVFANSGNVNDIAILDVFFDGNGQSGSPVSQANSFISLTGAVSKNVLLRGCTFYNQSGWNAVLIAQVSNGSLGQNIRVDGCSFLQIGDNATLTDHVALYVQGEGVVITGCTFFNDPAISKVPRNNGQGIQCQGVGVAITGCQFTNLANAILFLSAYSSPAVNSQALTVVGNTFKKVSIGVQFAQAVGTTLSDIAICGNAFCISNDAQGQAEACVSCTSINGGTGAGINRITISGNTCLYEHDGSFADASPAAISFTSIVSSCVISGNTIEGWPQGAIVVVPTAASNPNAPAGVVATSDLKLPDLKIRDNLIKDCGLVRGSAVLVVCDTVGLTTQRLEIKDNHICSTGATLTLGFSIEVAGDDVQIVGNTTQNVTTPFTLSSTNGITHQLTGGVIADDGTTTALGKSGHTVTFTGAPTLANSQYVVGTKVGGGTKTLLSLDTNDALRLNAGADAIVMVGAPASITSATAGDLLMAKNKWLRWSSDTEAGHRAIGFDGTNVVLCADADPLKLGGVALGAVAGGSAATYAANGIGLGGNPTTAAQAGWVKFLDSSGAAFWLPAWR